MRRGIKTNIVESTLKNDQNFFPTFHFIFERLKVGQSYIKRKKTRNRESHNEKNVHII